MSQLGETPRRPGSQGPRGTGARWRLDVGGKARRNPGRSLAHRKTRLSEGRLWVCAVTRRRFPVGASPPRQPLQPESTGAGMEATKCLKPSGSGSRIGDRASVQAATRVNAEQASKTTMCRPTRRPFRGRLIRPGEMSDEYARPLHRGSGGSMYTRKAHATRETPTRDQDQPDAREGQAGRAGVAERLVVPLKPGNAGGGKGPQFKTNAASGEGPGDWAT